MDTEPLDQSHEPLMLRLGLVVSRWAFVEWLEADFLSYLMSADPGRMHLITKNVSASTITEWLRLLAPVQFSHPATQERLALLLARISGVRAERNALVHGLWTAGSVEGTANVTTIKIERAEMMKVELVTADDLESLLDEIGEIYTELASLGDKLGFHPRPNPDGRGVSETSTIETP